MANRLAHATSPYLEQHKDNPVDWWQWSTEAFEEARRREVPVLISVGYAACHWCHVMAHESFEDEGVAELVNQNLVAIKVDREERPDVDAVYMTATQAMTGQGGWPMTVFATPDGKPFFCGTYFPREAFVRLVRSVTQAWRDQREAVLAQGAAVVEAVARSQGLSWPDGAGPAGTGVSAELLDAAANSLYRDYDASHGGFGGAPKFPPHLALLFLLRHYQRTGDAQALEVSRHTAEAMARGGIYDQLAGGFARYSVDATWTVPHFEKMLYDNALLLRCYTLLYRLTGDLLARRIAIETAEFVVQELFDGGFLASLDADTEGVEGRTYVWTPGELDRVLGPELGAWAADLYQVTVSGTFEHGRSVLRLARDIDDAEAEVVARWAAVRDRLLEARRLRPQPQRDDKVVAAWNGLAIVALVEFSLAIDDVSAVGAAAAARSAAQLLADLHLVQGRLRRVSRAGVVGAPDGVLEDYGAVAEAFCAMHQLTGDGDWLTRAGQLLDVALARFSDGRGGFHDTADDAEQLVARPADPTDNATPSGLSAAVSALIAYTALTGQTRYREAAEQALSTVVPLIASHARFAGYAAAAAEALLSGPYEIAIASAEPDTDELAGLARRLAPPGAVVVVGEPDARGVPLLSGRNMIDGRSTAYVCRGFVCDRPVSTVAELSALLAPLAGTSGRR
ncbi:MAG TPA: thioredoxin domain-containing protein [Micromonosporaceae bacterium]